MPRGDRSGPMGMGPMSGRASGYCANNETPGFMNRFFGRGSGLHQRLWPASQPVAGIGQNRQGGGQGRCFGWRNMFRNIGFRQASRPTNRMEGGDMKFSNYSAPQSNPNTEKQALQEQVEVLKTQMGLLQKRLDELSPHASDE